MMQLREVDGRCICAAVLTGDGPCDGASKETSGPEEHSGGTGVRSIESLRA